MICGMTYYQICWYFLIYFRAHALCVMALLVQRLRGERHLGMRGDIRRSRAADMHADG